MVTLLVALQQSLAGQQLVSHWFKVAVHVDVSSLFQLARAAISLWQFVPSRQFMRVLVFLMWSWCAVHVSAFRVAMCTQHAHVFTAMQLLTCSVWCLS